MKKAAVLTFINTTGGQYRWWDEFPSLIGEGLRRSGVEHICFRRDYAASSTEPPEARHPTPEGSLGDARWLRENVRPVAAAFEKVIFHTHGHYQPIRLGREVAHHGRARWFWTEHRIAPPRGLDALRKAARTVGQRLGMLPCRLYGVSEAGADRLRQQFRAASVRCIRTGIRLLPPAQRAGVRRPLTPRKALYVGRMIEDKGCWTLLRAFDVLRRRNVDASLTLVGAGRVDQVRRFVDEGRLGDRTRVVGFQREIEPFYREADFVIVPTIVPEALGMVSLEARMHGLPVIYSRRGGLPETQIDGVTGLGLPEVTPEAIADQVVRLQSDPAGYAEMSRRATLGLEEFSIETMIESYLREYLEVLSSLG
jgi:glycosyltransferase involved in cell wall biosynthesis